jgi:hypothetical protein
MSLVASFIERFIESQPVIDSKRRTDSIYYFSTATAKKEKREAATWSPTNVGFQGHRRYPNIVIENWAAAWKVRRHFEDQTELRKAKGLPVYQ